MMAISPSSVVEVVVGAIGTEGRLEVREAGTSLRA
jgi:hypothetical protein